MSNIVELFMNNPQVSLVGYNDGELYCSIKGVVGTSWMSASVDLLS